MAFLVARGKPPLRRPGGVGLRGPMKVWLMVLVGILVGTAAWKSAAPGRATQMEQVQWLSAKTVEKLLETAPSGETS